MIPPLIKGGQGRSQADIRRTATAQTWTILFALALLVACCGANR